MEWATLELREVFVEYCHEGRNVLCRLMCSALHAKRLGLLVFDKEGYIPQFLRNPHTRSQRLRVDRQRRCSRVRSMSMGDSP